MLSTQLSDRHPFTVISPEVLKKLGEEIELPDKGETVKKIADTAAGGAFDPRNLEKVPGEAIGYNASWAVERYPYYGLNWDITGLRLESLDPEAGRLPWLIIINGGSANFYEFFLDPLNRPGLGQYLAQKANIMLVTIPGNFKYGGWRESYGDRAPQYLLDNELATEEVKVRNAIYTNRMEIEGLKRLILRHTTGDILITGHSTSGELAFLAMGEKVLAQCLNGRFLGWGSGGPSNLRKEWEEQVGIRNGNIKMLSGYPPVWEIRSRGAKEYVKSGYIGPLNPCGRPGMDDLNVAQRWLSQVETRRPNFKQVLQDIEHHGMVELQSKIEAEIQEVLSSMRIQINAKDVFKDLFATNHSPLNAYEKMLWTVAKWDQGHWHKEDPAKARELTIADQFRERNPGAEIRILVLDMPMTHYGHIEKPAEVAGVLIESGRWLAV